MKKKNRIFSLLLALVMLPCVMLLSACGGNSGGGSETPPTPPTPPTHVEQPEKKPMRKYFSGVKATYTKENFLDSNNQAREFKDLVDRQIDVLAQDILARLDYVYGQHRTQPGSYVWGYAFPLYDLTGNEEDKIYRYYSDSTKDGLPALTDSLNMLSQLSKEYLDTIYEGTATLAEVNVDDLSDYQKSLLIKDTDANIFANTSFFNQIGASSGQNMKLVSKLAEKILDLDESKQWLVSDLTSKDAKDALKLMIAQELVGNESDDYDALIGLIDTLGYKPDFSENLIKIINNKIIGADRITEDNGYYDIIKNKYEGKITPNNVKSMNTSSDYSETNSPRLYKGYKVIVKQLVESALGNKFYNTQVSLYPKFSKKAVNYTSNANGFSEAHAYETMTLLPKDNTPYTKLVVKIKGSSIATSDVSLSLDVKINNSEISHRRINLTNEEQTLEIDASEFGSRTLAAYKGTKDADINENIFTNTQVSDKDESNYIKFTFTNKSGVKFTVTFDGYYNI